jgi:hypothetical protein
MKLIICGHGRHGKDTACEWLKDKHKRKFVSSSWFLTKPVIWPVLGSKYNTIQECFEDRHNHRQIWYDLITAYNTPDASRLGREIFAEYDIYCGLRNRNELIALKQCMPVTVVWVDRSKLLPPESSASNTITEQDADYVLDNNHTLSYLYDQIDNLMHELD